MKQVTKPAPGRHTEGPWTVLYSSGVYPSIHAGGTNIPVATLYAHTPVRSEHDVFINAEANAYLIAAAPELLKALEILLACSMPVDMIDRTAIELAKSAIAKARGSE